MLKNQNQPDIQEHLSQEHLFSPPSVFYGWAFSIAHKKTEEAHFDFLNSCKKHAKIFGVELDKFTVLLCQNGKLKWKIYRNSTK